MPTHRYDYSKLVGFTLAFIYFFVALLTPSDWRLIDSVNLVIHEAGHTIFLIFPEFFTILGGSLFQILIPTLFSIYFFRQGERFSGYLVLFWVAQSFANVSLYAGDAVRMHLDLLGGDGTIHDWNYLLSNLGMLEETEFVSATLYGIGWIIFLRAAFGALVASTKKVALRREGQDGTVASEIRV